MLVRGGLLVNSPSSWRSQICVPGKEGTRKPDEQTLDLTRVWPRWRFFSQPEPAACGFSFMVYFWRFSGTG